MPKNLMKATARAIGKTQISISLSLDLVDKIDSLAQEENRNRSNFIATHLERLVAKRDEQTAQHEAPRSSEPLS